MPVTIQPATLRYKANGEYQLADSIKGDKGAKGDPGLTPQLSVGEVATGDAGSDASVTITGTAAAPVLNMSIPKGDKGDIGATPHISVGTIQTGEPGTNVTVSFTGTPEAPILNMSVPRGYNGPAGNADLIASEYYELVFPVSKGSHCLHDGKYYEANIDINSSEGWTPGHWTEIPNVGKELADVRYQAEISANDTMNTFHNVRKITSVEAYGNAEAFGTVHLANGKNYMPDLPDITDSGSGLSVTFNGHYITVTGTESETKGYRTGTFDYDLPAGSYTIVMFADGTYTNASNCYVQFYGKRSDGTTDTLRSMYFNGATYYTWSFTASYDYVKMSVVFQGRAEFSVTDTLKLWFGIYPSGTVVTDSGISLQDGETATIPVDPANYANGVDTMQHGSTVLYHPTVKEYVDSHKIDINKELTYTTPEAFGARGDNIRDDTAALNLCVAYSLSKNIPIRGFGTYKTTQPISIIGNNFDIYIKHIRYTGNDYAVYYQGQQSKLQFGVIESSGDGMYLTGETQNMHYNTFIIGVIDAAKNGIHIHANKSIYSNRVVFDYIAGGAAYSCIYMTRDPNTQTGYSSEWHFEGGYVTRALWGIRGYIGETDVIDVYSENLGSDGNGGAIWCDMGTIPKIRYVRTGEIQNHNTVLKISGVFSKKQSPGSTGVIGMTLNAIDITELTLPSASDLVSDNAQAPTNFIIHKTGAQWVNLTNSLILWGNRFQFPQSKYIVKNISDDLDMTDQYYQDVIPQKFVIDSSDVRIDLHPTYASNCLGEFIVEQKNGYKADVYDCCGHLIFDGSDYENGIYKLKAYVVDSGLTTTASILRYDMSNQLWKIDRVSSVSSTSNFMSMINDHYGP